MFQNFLFLFTESSCEIDVGKEIEAKNLNLKRTLTLQFISEYFPFDEQTCVMKFGSWTYDGFQVEKIFSLNEGFTDKNAFMQIEMGTKK